MSAAKPRPGTLRKHETIDLGKLLGSEWDGFLLSAAGLQHPYWRRPFSCAELKAMFWRCQQVTILENEVRLLKKDCERALAAEAKAEEQAEWYRRQLVLESRMGWMLERLNGALS